MNIRLSGQHLRFRLTRDELVQLAAGKIVGGLTHFPNGTNLRYAVQPAPRDATYTMAVTHAEDSIVLRVNPQLLSTMAATEPTRQGMTAEQGELQISLEVDVKKT